MNDEERIEELEQKLVELKSRLPRHSVPPAMIIELEEMEEELHALRVQTDNGPR